MFYYGTRNICSICWQFKLSIQNNQRIWRFEHVRRPSNERKKMNRERLRRNSMDGLWWCIRNGDYEYIIELNSIWIRKSILHMESIAISSSKSNWNEWWWNVEVKINKMSSEAAANISLHTSHLFHISDDRFSANDNLICFGWKRTVDNLMNNYSSHWRYSENNNCMSGSRKLYGVCVLGWSEILMIF